MIVLLKDKKLSTPLCNLFLQWQEEYEHNREHDTNEVIAWNRLVEYLIKLEESFIKET